MRGSVDDPRLSSPCFRFKRVLAELGQQITRAFGAQKGHAFGQHGGRGGHQILHSYRENARVVVVKVAQGP